MAVEELTLAKEVSASAEDCETFVVPNGKRFKVLNFHGSAAFQPNAAVKLVWDFGGAGETIVWAIKGQDEMPFAFNEVGDGTKKIAVCLENGETGALFLSGYARIWVED